jgi:hypothetical protein
MAQALRLMACEFKKAVKIANWGESLLGEKAFCTDLILDEGKTHVVRHRRYVQKKRNQN